MEIKKDFKFRVGDIVWITHTANRQPQKITQRCFCNYDGQTPNKYKVKGGRWWDEDRLVLITAKTGGQNV